VTHDIAEWREEIPWMSLYFSAAVWASLALCVCYSFSGYLPRHLIEAPSAICSSSALTMACKQAPPTHGGI
jgi:hypothetical protein